MAVYRYHDSQGKLIFEKLRYEPKRFVQRRPNGKGGYEYKLGDARKPLYRLPELLVSKYIAICEGEKDCDNVLAVLRKGKEIAATTNFDGAGKWRDEDSVYFAGKQVVIIADNDEIGRKHAQRVAASIHPYAAGIRVVNLPGLGDHEDVSDYLASGHSSDELLQELKKAPQWFPLGSRKNYSCPPRPSLLKSRIRLIGWWTKLSNEAQTGSLQRTRKRAKAGLLSTSLFRFRLVASGLGSPFLDPSGWP